ncbi:sensor histidine kinase [Mucilaginibacter aquaedulcis]|uniref:sensor histidine kinase n=1 Tax=Mucilaginibacter aquaedulcis TaxID=1187081 RepID=UPI0025B499EE|nr:CHASE3 domain-containing protein [Mucilaginibacter aquaedulcis]MDN3548936.1 CHASE3 domain-containing protein [Mucilaginibacter aquaedulcis]
MTNKLNRNLRLGYGFSIIILLIVGTVSWLTYKTLINSNRAVAHSGEVMQKLEKLLSVMKDAETGQRGYLLSGQDSYLEPYNGAYKEAQDLGAELQKLTADNAGQQTNIAAIRDILHLKLDILQLLVNKKQRHLPVSGVDLNAGKSAMDGFRKAIARAEYDEQILLRERIAKWNRYTRLVPAFILIAILTAVFISLFSYRKVTRDIREKDRLRRELEASEEETQSLNEELTAANEEITAANEELTAINEEVVEARDELARANNLLEQRVAERTEALQASEEVTQALNEELSAINEEMMATNEELMVANEELSESQQQLQNMVDELRQADERNAKLVAIVEASDDAIIGKDLEGVVTAWNRGAEQIFGYKETDIVGQSMLKIVPEDLWHEEHGLLTRLRNGEKIDHYETVRRTSDSRLIDVSLTISPIFDKEGRVTGVSKIARDISEQKRDDQRKNDFIGMASHELKTPLTSLTALIQVLQQKLKDNAEPFVANALNKANQQTKKMTSLINGFLNISRLESGKLEIHKESFDLVHLVEEQIDELSMVVSGHTFVFKPESAIAVSADWEKIGAVISNLLSNAVKYSPKETMVTVRCLVENDHAVLSVQDEGMGINPEDLSKIFDRYYRVGTEYTKHISGFGIGLYLSSEIIQRHDGKVWAESEPGAGSTFYFSLPLERS